MESNWLPPFAKRITYPDHIRRLNDGIYMASGGGLTTRAANILRHLFPAWTGYPDEIPSSAVEQWLLAVKSPTTAFPNCGVQTLGCLIGYVRYHSDGRESAFEYKCEAYS